MLKKKKAVWKVGTYFLIVVLGLTTILTACAGPEETAEPAAPAPAPAPTSPAPTAPAPSAPAPTAPAAPGPTAPAPTELEWWEEAFGQPQYGDKITIARDRLGDNFDLFIPWTSNFYPYEQLFIGDLTLDPEVWSYKVGGSPPNFVGLLAETWEWEDAQTLVINLRQDVKWQNKAPTYGRAFTAADVIYHYDRVLGTGEFTEPNPFSRRLIDPVETVTARDDYTIVVNFKSPATLVNWWAITDPGGANQMEPREFVELGNPGDWENCAGTGAFMVTDYIPGNSITMAKNPDYYRYDMRYPDCKLPYVDELKIMYIVDTSTQVAAIRSGQVDLVFDLDWETALNLQKTNPDLVLSKRPYNGFCIDMRNDREPFTDIRVRKALQLAIDTQTIAKSYFGGLVDGNPAPFVSTEYKGWSLPYEEWPADLQQEYAYNVEGAKALLAEAGFPDGFETNAYIATEDDVDLLQIIKSYFADIGVEMTINTMDQNQLIAFYQAGNQDQMVVREYCNTTWPVNISFGNRTSNNAANTIYAAAEEAAVYDDLYEQFMEAPDEATAKQLMIEAAEYSYRQHWSLIVTGRVRYDAGQSWVRGWNGEQITGFSQVWFWTNLWVDKN